MVIRRFDVFRNPSPRSASTIPFVVVIQSELLDDLPTRVVVPLIKTSALDGKAAARLNPRFEIEGHSVVLLTQQIGAVPSSTLKRRISSLEDARDEIIQALDLLFSGI